MRGTLILVATLLGPAAFGQEPPVAPPPSDAQAAPAPAAQPVPAEVVQAPPAAPAPVARIKGSVFVESNETVDSSNAKDKAKHIDFGVSLRAALIKKNVPVKIVTDPAKAELLIKSTSSHREDSTGTKIAKIAFFGGGGFGHFEGSIEVIDNESSAVVFAYNVKKGDYQSAAEAFAKHFKNDYLDKRRP
jgi:hypothetical protein